MAGGFTVPQIRGGGRQEPLGTACPFAQECFVLSVGIPTPGSNLIGATVSKARNISLPSSAVTRMHDRWFCLKHQWMADSSGDGYCLQSMVRQKSELRS